MSEHIYNVWTDGGSRGNPGPAAYGFVLKGTNMETLEHGETIGETTNNVAEYTAVIEALKKLKSVLGNSKAGKAVVNIHADSELLVKQLKGEYRVKDEGLKKLFMELHNVMLDFDSVSYTHVRREKNKEADRMVNHALDKEQTGLDI